MGSVFQYLKSKTVWAQVLMVGTTIGAMFGVDIPQEHVAEVAAGLASLFAIINVVIRAITTQPILEK